MLCDKNLLIRQSHRPTEFKNYRDGLIFGRSPLLITPAGDIFIKSSAEYTGGIFFCDPDMSNRTVRSDIKAQFYSAFDAQRFRTLRIIDPAG